jgi:hypothetical protein
MQCSDALPGYNVVDSIERATIMPQFGPTFPAFDEWEKMSESDQDALIARMERARRRRNGLFGILIALIFVGIISTATSAVGLWPW